MFVFVLFSLTCLGLCLFLNFWMFVFLLFIFLNVLICVVQSQLLSERCLYLYLFVFVFACICFQLCLFVFIFIFVFVFVCICLCFYLYLYLYLNFFVPAACSSSSSDTRLGFRPHLRQKLLGRASRCEQSWTEPAPITIMMILIITTMVVVIITRLYQVVKHWREKICFGSRRDKFIVKLQTLSPGRRHWAISPARQDWLLSSWQSY